MVNRPTGSLAASSDRQRHCKYHVSVEEFRNITAARGEAAGFGPYDHGSRPLAVGISNGCAPGDLVFAAVGSNSGPRPSRPPAGSGCPSSSSPRTG